VNAPRLIPRREVLAFIALNGDESTMPIEIRFREYIYVGDEWHVIALAVDTEAAVRHWANAFGHGANHFSSNVHARDDGTQYMVHKSHDYNWRGFITEVRANVDLPVQEPLDADTEARLREIGGDR
jgi:hypothetical protein